MLVYGLPVVAAVAVGLSAFGVRTNQFKPRNEMVTGSIGEAKILNPILSTSASDSEVEAYVFGSLLEYDENLEVTPSLAESWTLSQETTLYFADAAAASEALGRVQSARNQFPDWGVESVASDGDRVRVRLSKPGSAATRALRGVIGEERVLPLETFPIEFGETPGNTRDEVLAALLTQPGVRKIWRTGPSLVEVAASGAGAAGRVADWLARDESPGKCGPAETLGGLEQPEIVFRLRKDVRWHDGQPFTAADAVFTVRMLLDDAVASPRRADYELIESYEATDPYTFRVVYRRPYSPALLSWMMGLLPRHLLEGKPTTWWAENFNRKPIGTGPFRFAEWRSNEYIRLVRNDDYFKGRPHLDAVNLRVIPDQVAIRLAFETRQIDFWAVDPHAVGAFEQKPEFSLFSGPSASYAYLGWNLRRPLFQDVRVRRALAHAVNVPDMVRYLLYGRGSQSLGTFPPQMWFANPDIRPYAYDPDEARRLLAEAGWVPGADGILARDGRRFAFDLLTNQANEVRKDIATLVQADLRKIGIEVKVQVLEWTVFISEHVNKADFDAVVLGWNLGYDYDQYQIWHSSQSGPGQLNVGGYANPEVDRLLAELRTEFDRDRIATLAGTTQRLIYEDQPYLFLYVPESCGAMWRDVYRIRRPEPSSWKEEPVTMTKAGFAVHREWFYRPDHRPVLVP